MLRGETYKKIPFVKEAITFEIIFKQVNKLAERFYNHEYAYDAETQEAISEMTAYTICSAIIEANQDLEAQLVTGHYCLIEGQKTPHAWLRYDHTSDIVDVMPLYRLGGPTLIDANVGSTRDPAFRHMIAKEYSSNEDTLSVFRTEKTDRQIKIIAKALKCLTID